MILNGSKLKDNHINAFHNIAKMQFRLIGGLHNSLLLNKTLLNLEDYEQSLQMLFIPDRSHWAVLQVGKCDVYLCDSMFTSPSEDTQRIIAQLVQSKDKYFNITVMNVQRQTNSVDCGLYATAMLASLLLGQDPMTIVYNQGELRLHLRKS